MTMAGTAERLLDSARELLEAGGVEAVTMRRVAQAVGITAMAVYRHFADRDALLMALAEEGFGDMAGRLRGAAARDAGDAEAGLWALLDANLDFAMERPQMFALMFLRLRPGARQFPRDFRAGRSPTAGFLTATLEKGMAAGVFREDDAWELVFAMGAMLQGLVMLYQGGRVEMSPEEFRGLCHRAFARYVDGIRARV